MANLPPWNLGLLVNSLVLIFFFATSQIFPYKTIKISKLQNRKLHAKSLYIIELINDHKLIMIVQYSELIRFPGTELLSLKYLFVIKYKVILAHHVVSQYNTIIKPFFDN